MVVKNIENITKLNSMKVQSVIMHYAKTRVGELTNFKEKSEYEYTEIVGRMKELQHMASYFASINNINFVDKNNEDIIFNVDNNG
jgi:hypothetical protein